MKSTYLILICLFVMSSTSAQNQFNFFKDHEALLVQDVNESAKFYGDILGLKEIPNGGLSDHIRWFELGDKVQIHLIESTDSIVQNKGIHMAIQTTRLDEFMDSLKKKNIPFENWNGEAETTNTRPDGIKQIYLRDPDGYWIEINDNRF